MVNNLEHQYMDIIHISFLQSMLNDVPASHILWISFRLALMSSCFNVALHLNMNFVSDLTQLMLFYALRQVLLLCLAICNQLGICWCSAMLGHLNFVYFFVQYD